MKFQDFFNRRIDIKDLIRDEGLTLKEFLDIYIAIPYEIFPASHFGFTKDNIRKKMFDILTDYIISEIGSIEELTKLERFKNHTLYSDDEFARMIDLGLSWYDTTDKQFWADTHKNFRDLCRSLFKSLV